MADFVSHFVPLGLPGERIGRYFYECRPTRDLMLTVWRYGGRYEVKLYERTVFNRAISWKSTAKTYCIVDDLLSVVALCHHLTSGGNYVDTIQGSDAQAGT